jgi:hypothetical protein
MPAGFGKIAAVLTCAGALIALAQAARDARLDQIDAFRKQCGDRRRVADWLKDVVGDSAKSIRWSGGRCRLTNKLTPARWRDQLVRPGRDHAATRPARRHHRGLFRTAHARQAGRPFAFRAIADTKDGPDTVRETFGFAVNWKQMHVPGYVPPGN